MNSVLDQPSGAPVHSSVSLWALLRDCLILRSWQGRLVWVLLLIGPAWAADRAVFLWSRQSAIRNWTQDFSRTARQFGEPAGIAFVVVGILVLDKQRRRFLAPLIAAILLTSGAASALKLLVGRERPKVTAGATVLDGPQLQWPSQFDRSFPSGHTAAAFALAYGIAQIYSTAAGLCALYAATCGVSRVLSGSHFVSDVLVGAWLGWETARLAWNSRKLRHLLSVFSRAREANATPKETTI